MTDWFNDYSNGKLTFKIQMGKSWIRTPKNSSYYDVGEGVNQNSDGQTISQITQQLIDLTSSQFEYANADVVQFLFSEGHKNSEDELGWVVSQASKAGKLDVVQFLLSEGRQIRNQDRFEAVEAAAGRGYPAIVQFLLSAVAEIDSNCFRRFVDIAISSRHIEVLYLLLQRWGSNNLDSHMRGQALLLASNQGHADAVELLLQAPIFPSTRDSALTRAHGLTEGEDRSRIISMLEMARLQTQGNQLIWKGLTQISSKEVKEDPDPEKERWNLMR